MRIVTDLIMDVATKNSRYVRVVESFSTDKKGNPIRGTEMPLAYILP